MSDYVFEFKRNGIPCGFAASTDREFIFKPDKYSAVIFPLENLKNNLRSMVKAKTAKIIKAGEVEAVVVPEKLFNDLFI